MTIYRIWPNSAGPIDAKIELDDRAVVLHSRGGPTGGRPPRNTEYSRALDFIVDRLTSRRQWLRRVLIDSKAARRDKPDANDRVLLDADEITALGSTEAIVREIGRRARAFGQVAGTSGGNATKQVRLETDWLHSALRGGLNLRIIDASGESSWPSASAERLTSEQQRRVTVAHVDAAVASLLSGNDAPNFAESRDYDLLTEEGYRLAPKKVFGRALEQAGVVAKAYPHHFSAGWSQPSFEILQVAGYTIIGKTEAAAEASRRRRRALADAREVDKAAATVGIDTEERSWIEGDKRMAKHLRFERRRSAKAAATKRAAVRAVNDGRLACEHCAIDWYATYPPAIAESIFDVHHTIPLKDMDEGHETEINDLLCLCANCHRVEHRRMSLE